ncbi:MAG TPA: NADH-ubiquinone oxidoreductase-F iron-sulfur binding region domain-containing protein [Actinomycetes bacterium]|nr:NADH-ubiquinone oxidoreductase-F iron-sulfur binding region domain-containing protein [Actinomycetes bacterium]
MRLIAGTRPDRPLTLAEHLAVHGALPRTGRGLVDEVETSGLTGRGGAGYPLAGKMRTVQSQSRLRGRPVVVVNAAESEPAAVKDASLVTRAPHLVLDGAAACARAVGAREVVVWVHRGGQGAEQAVETAAFERLSVGLDTVRVEVVAGPDRYVSGEASAIVRHLSGGPAMPSATAYRTAERGVRGRPTLLANAETFAHAGLVARHGAAWFRSVGPPDEPGTMLATVRGGVVRPGVVEVPLGAPLVEALEACGGLRTPVAALLVGGYGGSWLSWDAARTATLARASLAARGADLGTGLLLALPADRCALAEAERLVGWLAAESAGQCGPCLNGLPAMAADLTAMVTGDGSALSRLDRRASLVAGRGACHHPDGAVRLVRSTLDVFRAHVEQHLRAGRCRDLDCSPVAPLPAHTAVAGAESWR